MVNDRETGLQAFIALHDTTLGPAAGGTRMRVYPTLDAAAVDALRLARAMTAKAALCGVARGGGKAVILGDPARDKSEALLLAYGRAVDRLGGRFHTGPDMGFDGTRRGRHGHRHALRQPHPRRAFDRGRGPRGPRCCCGDRGHGPRPRSRARRADGSVCRAWARWECAWRGACTGAGARLVVADLDEDRVEQARATLQAQAVPPIASTTWRRTSSLPAPRGACSTTRRSRACAAEPWWERPTSSSPSRGTRRRS